MYKRANFRLGFMYLQPIKGVKDTMPRLRGAAVGEGDLSSADVGGLVCLPVDEASLGLPERHWLAHAETGPCHVATLLAQSVAIFLSSWVCSTIYPLQGDILGR